MKKFAILLLFFITYISPASAQDKLVLSITPPLIKNNMSPGQIWKSSVKLVNNNPHEIDAYIQIRDFKSGEGNASVQFLPAEEPGSETNAHRLSGWIVAEPGPYKIPANSSETIPFIIHLPEDVEPGGHYAAILTGTKPPAADDGGSVIKVSSLLASLLMINVAGDIEERGSIREFYTDKKYYQSPSAQFTMRFENQGNVHLQPRGEIHIFNMWGDERGRIVFNHDSEFGHVLPDSEREWRFTWKAEGGLSEIGRYKAMLVLNYGEQEKVTIDQTLYFYVIQLKLLLLVIGGILFVVLSSWLFIRRYIRRAVLATQLAVGSVPSTARQVRPAMQTGGEAVISLKTDIAAPSLKAEPAQIASFAKTRKRVLPQGLTFRLFRRFALAVIIFAVAGAAGFYYFEIRDKEIKSEQSARPDAIFEDSQVSVIDSGSGTAGTGNDAGVLITDGPEISPAETEMERLSGDEETASGTDSASLDEATSSDAALEPAEPVKADLTALKIRILNGGGRTGAAGAASSLLVAAGYAAPETGNADNFNYTNTVIRYKKGDSGQAATLMALFGEGAELSETSGQAEDIVVILGRNFVF